MGSLEEVKVGTLAPERFREALDEERYEKFSRAVAHATDLFAGRKIVNINSTARGGGVAEMLRSLLAYARGANLDARWLVIPGDPDFFRITKRLHNHLHGAPGDGGGLGDDERAAFEESSRASLAELEDVVEAGDIVIVHDPQPAALVAPLRELGALVIWRCHIGLDEPNDLVRNAWSFLTPYVEAADAYVFSREAFAWGNLARPKISIIPPSIDAFSPKNQDLSSETVSAILAAAGLIAEGSDAEPVFEREDGSPARVGREAQVADDQGPVPSGAPLVVQVSRWDRLKDPVGVIRGFAEFVAPHHEDAHLVVAGPDVTSVADDPEGREVLEECIEVSKGFDDGVRARIRLASLPMEDGEENAAIVNALQRRADVVVQKSIAEGFGLTVAEGMWKARAVVASKIGGIQDQIVHGESGILLDDPTDLEEYGRAVSGLLDDPERAARLGAEARERVRDEFLGARHLIQYLELIEGLLSRRSGTGDGGR